MKRVLLIDDEASMEHLVSLSLEHWDVRVHQVMGCDEAIRAAIQDPPDVILLDLALGEEDGLTVLPALRAEKSLEDVPIVIFSVHESRRHEALEAGADAFIPKPFTERHIHSTLGPFLS